MGKRPTIEDVAQQAEVSKSTVSHVVNNTRFVELETRQRVLAAIAMLGYRPNLLARSLTTKRTGTIGMIISDASNFFFGEMLRGVEDVLQPQSYSLIVCNTDETLDREAHYLDVLLRQRVDGIMAAATSQDWDVLGQVAAQDTPVVFVDRTFAGMVGPYVGADNAGGAALGTHHLLAQGQRRIGILAGFERLSSMHERLAGFQAALQEYGIVVPEEWIGWCPLSIEDGKATAMRLLSLPERPSALFINNNLLSLGTLLALKELGLRCPDDIAIVGFDDHPWAAVAHPPLTVVRQPARLIGQQAAQILCGRIAGNEPKEMHLALACDLVVRESCGALRSSTIRLP